MSSDGRFYQLAFRHRPVLEGDIGSLLQIEGILVGGNGAHAVLLLPSAKTEDIHPLLGDIPWYLLTGGQWSEYLRRSDDPEILVNGSPEKAFHRKLRYEISGLTQQKIWKADGLKCMYCHRLMGEVQLTVDHFLPLELGGVNEVANYLSACRKCNKDKGSNDPRAFCADRGLDYDLFVEYLSLRVVK
jgi:HNH endonuclease